jgi:hypothetical protein
MRAFTPVFDVLWGEGIKTDTEFSATILVLCGLCDLG